MKRHLPEWDDGERAKIAFDKIWDDLAELPLLQADEIDRVVDGGHFTWNTIKEPWRISETQQQILFALSRGFTVGEISKARGIGQQSVSTQLKRVRIRLRVKTNEEAVSVAIGSGIIDAIDRDPELGDRINVRGISARLKDTLKLMAQGETNSDIAQLLGVSEEAIKDRVKELCNLMGARNRTHAVSLAFTTGRLTMSGWNNNKKRDAPERASLVAVQSSRPDY